MTNYLNYLVDVALLALGLIVFMIWAFTQRGKNEKFMRNKIVAEIWLEKGGRIRLPLIVEDNGIEVKCPNMLDEKKCPRYIFSHNDIDDTKWPENASFGFTAASARMVSWAENNPEPINPRRKKPLVTSQLIDTLRDNDFLAFATAASREIELLQKQLMEALSKSTNKWFQYIGISLAVIAGGASFYYLYSFVVPLLNRVISGFGL